VEDLNGMRRKLSSLVCEGNGVCVKRKLVKPTFQEFIRPFRLANNRRFERE